MKETYIFGQRFPVVNVSIEISGNKGRMLKGSRRKHRYLIGKSSMPTMFLTFSRPPTLKLFCTQSSHGQIGKRTCPAESWTLKTISYY